VQRHLVQHDGVWRLLSHLSYRGEEFPRDRFLAELAVQVPGARSTGVDLVSEQLSSSVRRSFGWSFLLGGILVLLLLMIHFDSRVGIFAALFPVFAGGVTMLGLMVLTGMKLNFMNVMVIITILGMGSDYGLHIFHRAGGVGPEQREQFIQAGRAVLLSALTTIAGFGSLAFTDYGAMSSIGWATNYGIVATAFFSMVSLPAFLALRRTFRSD
jgi:predicted RND superfamily exporter protein